MKIIPFIKNTLIKTLLITTLMGCSTNSDKVNTKQRLIEAVLKEEKIENINEKETKIIPWKDVGDYNKFVRSAVDENYKSDIKEMYKFYNIKRELPPYGFKSKDLELMCFDCTGAVYKENSDSIYFYYNCSEELFKRFIEYNKDNKEDIEEYFIDKTHYYIKHEAAHAFYYGLGRQLGEEYLFKVNYKNTNILYNIQHSIIEEGVAEYMAYKGQLTETAKLCNNEDFKRMIQEETDFPLYDLGFVLVKPILDKNFEWGIIQLIKNPLNKNDLNNLPAYQEKILNKLK